MNFFDFVRKILFTLTRFVNFDFLQKFRAFFYFKTFDLNVGKNVTLKGIGFRINLGKDLNIYDNCVFELGPDSELHIGNKVILSYGCLVSVRKSLVIGDFVQVGEYTSIRDTTHDYTDYLKPMMNNHDISQSIIIGNNVWIGRNCLISPGSIIEDGVVIGANAIVKGRLLSDRIYVGHPLRELKVRPKYN